MKRLLTGLVAAATIAGAAVATSAPAQARWGWGWGWGVGAFAAGAVIGSALAAPYYYPPYPYYYGPYPYYGRPCAWRQVWNGVAWVRACV